MVKRGNFCFVVLALIMCSSLVIAISDYDSKALVKNYSIEDKTAKYPSLEVSVLKYNPYPVSSGEWFDLWVKVQNIGESDANNARFELQPSYPFSSNDSLVRDYGLIYGRLNSFKVDQTYDSSQVILKYRVYVEKNAPSGSSDLKFLTSIDGGISSLTFNLPIEVFSSTKNVPSADSLSVNTNSPLAMWTYAAVGFVCGIFLLIIFSTIRKKIKVSKVHHVK